jgi:hypothetical protein
MSTFFEPSYVNLVDSPNGRSWFQSMPLPDGSRIAGAHRDRNVQLKLWETLSLIEADVAGRTVLDIGANDGFFTVAALLAGAARVTAINTSDCRTYPTICYLLRNIGRSHQKLSSVILNLIPSIVPLMSSSFLACSITLKMSLVASDVWGNC